MSGTDWPVGTIAEVDIDTAKWPVEPAGVCVRVKGDWSVGISAPHWRSLDGEWVYQDCMVLGVRPKRLVDAAESPVEPSGGAGTPVDPVSVGSDAPGGHWCTIADDLAAQLAAAEEELAGYRRFAEGVARAAALMGGAS